MAKQKLKISSSLSIRNAPSVQPRGIGIIDKPRSIHTSVRMSEEAYQTLMRLSKEYANLTQSVEMYAPIFNLVFNSVKNKSVTELLNGGNNDTT